MPEITLGKGGIVNRRKQLIKLLVKERKARKIRQQELARRLHQHQSLVSRLESGERRIDVCEFLDLAEVIGFDPGVALKKIQSAACNGGRVALSSSLDEALTIVKAAGYRVSKPRAKHVKDRPVLNAIGKPYGANFDPNYKLKGVHTSLTRLYAPYGSRMKFVGDSPDTEEPRGRRRKAKTAPEKTVTDDASRTRTYWLSFANGNECGGFAVVDVREGEIGKAGAFFAAIRKSLQLRINPGPDYNVDGREIPPDAIPEEFKHRLLGRAEAEALNPKMQ